MKGECLCRRVAVEVHAAPEFINICNCKLCRKSGAAWGYYAPSAVEVSGTTGSYRRDDLGDEPSSEKHFCQECGCTTHFVVIHPEHGGMGINMRLFDQDFLGGIEVRYYDTRALSRSGGEARQSGTGQIGDGCAF